MTGIVADDGHAHPLVRQMFGIMRDERTSLVKFAAESGVDRTVLSLWRRRSSPTLVVFEAALNALGYELRIVKREGEGL